jgi:hypothetical protein
MPINGRGIELLVTRTSVQSNGATRRTYGTYQLFDEGAATAEAGHICECPGPGDNQHAGSKLRIQEGRYGLATQFGRYRTIGYSANLDPPLPALAVGDHGVVNKRKGILIHPAHAPALYLSSTGCMNPSAALEAAQDIDPRDSRARVIALIEAIKLRRPETFTTNISTEIPNCWVIIDGEP